MTQEGKVGLRLTARDDPADTIHEEPTQHPSKRRDQLLATLHRPTDNGSGLCTINTVNRDVKHCKQDRYHDLALNFIPVIAGGYIDPFDSSVVVIDEWAHTLISYYMMVVIPSMFRADSQATKAQLLNQSRHTSALFEDIQNCVSHRAHFYALLTSAASRMLRVEGKLLIPQKLKTSRAQGPEHLKTLAIQSLRFRLSDTQVDDLMVQDVYRLYAAEIMLGNFEAAEIHFSALNHMVNAIGGVQKLTPYTMERVILLDIFSAVQRLSPPKLELTWDPGPFPPCLSSKIKHISTDSCFAKLGQTLSNSVKSSVSHPALLTIISDLVPLTYAHLITWQDSQSSDTSPLHSTNLEPSNPPPYSAEGMHMLLLRRTALEHRLLSLPNPTISPHQHQEAVRLTLLLFMGMTFADPARRTITGRLRSHLRETLAASTDLQDELWWPWTNLLLWVCCIASLASEEAGDTEGWEFFGRLAARCRAAEGLGSLESVKDVLSGFFWVQNTRESTTERLFRRFDGWMMEGDGEEGRLDMLGESALDESEEK